MKTSENRTQWRALRKFMAFCMIFSAIIAVTLGVGEVLVRKYVPNPYRFKHERLKENSSDVSTLILGSSLGYYDIKPDILGDSVFDLANVSQNFKYDNLLLHNYEFPNLKRIFLPVAYSSFSDPDYENSTLPNLSANYKIYMDIDEYGDFSRYNFEFMRFFLYSQKLRSLLSEKKLSCDSLGFGLDFGPGEKSHPNWEYDGGLIAGYHTPKDESMLSFHLGNLKKIASFCRERNIELILYTPPAWKTYRDNLNGKQLSQVRRIANNIAAQNGFKYIDMLEDPRFDKDDFYDVNHLNQTGAAKFTKILRDTLKN